MKHLILIFVLLIAGVTSVVAQQYKTCDPDVQVYAEAECLDEIIYDRNGIPVNCPASKFKQFKRQRDREYRKYHGTRWIDRTGRSMQGLGRGFINFCVYIGTAVAITAGTIWVMGKVGPN